MSHMNSNCWVWTAGKNSDGYGTLRARGRVERAHRASMLLEHGHLPELCVLHSCDNPACVRPDHLSEGTHSENIKAAYDRGRKHPPTFLGERHPQAKLTASDVREIRRRCKEGETRAALAAAYGMGLSQVSRIVRRESWSHID